MHVSFHEGYRVDLPPTHPYPMGKYLLLRDVLAERGLIGPLRLVVPDEVPLDVLGRVHTPEYLAQLQGDTLDPAQRRRLGIPFTPRLWRRSRLTVEGTRLAADAALADGLAANMAGCSAFMVDSGALFTRNFYRKYLVGDRPDSHYLLIGRLISAAENYPEKHRELL